MDKTCNNCKYGQWNVKDDECKDCILMNNFKSDRSWLLEPVKQEKGD